MRLKILLLFGVLSLIGIVKAQNFLTSSSVNVIGNALPTEVTININLNVDENLSHLGFKINYDPLLLSVTESNITTIPTHFAPGWEDKIAVSVFPTGKIVWTASNLLGYTVINAGNSNLITIKFTALPALGYQTATVDINTLSAWDIILNSVNITTQDGSVNGLVPVMVTSSEPSPTSLSPIPFTIDFVAGVTGFTIDDLIIINGTAQDFVAVSSSKYTVNVIPNINGDVILTVPVGSAQHIVTGNTNAEGSFMLWYDNDVPSVTLSMTCNLEPTNVIPFVVTATFSEDVVGFEASDLTIVNGTAENMIGGPRIYTINVIPIVDGEVHVDLTAGKVKDIAGNDNTAAIGVFCTYDSTKPTVSISSGSGNPTNLHPFSITITFNEIIQAFTISNILVINGNAENLVEITTGRIWKADISPIINGVVNVNIAENVVKDLAGNYNTAAIQLSRIYDSNAPSVSVTSSAGISTPESIIPFAIDFSENVVSFELTDITVTNGTIHDFTETLPGISYTLNVYAASDGNVTVIVPATSATDTAGNNNTLGSATVLFSPNFDVDRDSFTNFRDVVFSYRHIVGHPTVETGVTLPPGETEEKINARINMLCVIGESGFAPLDVDMDGEANFRDIIFIFRYLFGLPTVKDDVILPPGVTEEDVNILIESMML